MSKERIKKRNIARIPGFRKAHRWVALGTLATYAAVNAEGRLQAQTPATSGQTAPASPSLPVPDFPFRRFEIAAAPLGSSRVAFEAVAAIHLEIRDSALLSVSCSPVSGVYTPEQALQLLLAGTGLGYRFSSKAVATVQLQENRSSVNVVADLPTLSRSLPKYQQSLSDTPQTVDVVPQAVMQQQNATTLRDVLRNVAGISLAAGEGGAQGDNLTVRGFTARNDLFIDGMRDFGSYYRDPFNTQEVEVLKGPSSVIFGRGSTGGVVNQAAKTPGLDRFLSADLQVGTDLTRRATIDFNAPVPALGIGAAFRLNAMGDLADVADRDVAENRRAGIAPTLVFGAGTRTRATLSYFHQSEDDNPDYGLPWLFNAPAAVPRTNYYGLRNGNYLRTNDDIGTARVEHDVNARWTLRDQFRYANYGRDVLITEAQLTGVVPETPLNAMTVTRHEIGVRSTETFLDDQLDTVGHVTTGPVRHTLVAGVEAGRETSDPTRFNQIAPSTSLLAPMPSDRLTVAPTVATQVHDTAGTAGVYATDTASFGKKLDLTGGVRWDRFDDQYTQFVTPSSRFARTDERATWRAAAVYKPASVASLYFDAGTSFNPSAETLALSAGTANLPPEQNFSYEFGSKWNLNNGRLTLNAAWFRTTKENAREASPTDSLLSVLAGTQRVSGVETDVRGKLTSRWDVLASYSYLDSRVVGSQFYPGAIAYPLANVPHHSFNMWNEYKLPKRFEVGLGANYVGCRNASATVPLDPTTGLVRQVPSYWIFNAMAGHPLNEHIDVQLNVYNLANRFYYDQIHPAHIVPGPGRSALLNFRFRF